MPRALRTGRAGVVTAAAPIRVAIYTRKSTDRGLDRDFTSIDNQRGVCERFTEQMEGAVLLPDRFDDGGYSGTTTDRPALQRLLADIKDGLVDCVVAYKYDRLGRSMIDCLHIFEFLKKHGVRFISVTQQIDTSMSHGRMFVNNLLSHAQYESDLISERTADKMQAARRKGKWTGGMPPLGYDTAPEGGRLVVNPDEAAMVLAIFELYAEIGSLTKVVEELNGRGWRRKSWATKTGKRREGGPWDRVSLRRLLTDPIYIGMQKLGDETFPGEHEAVVPKKLFDKVQQLMDQNRSDGGAAHRNRHGALLRGLLRCSACDSAMSFAPTKKNGKVYRYYRCSAAMKKGQSTCPTGCISADRVEAFVVDQIRRIGNSPGLQQETFRQVMAQVAAERRGLKAEGKRLAKQVAAARASVETLVHELPAVKGEARRAVSEQLEKEQERVRKLETRLAEVRAQLDALKAQDIDEADVARALQDFHEIWSVLLTPEKERVLKLLIDSIDYDGATEQLTIHYSAVGLATMAAELEAGDVA